MRNETTAVEYIPTQAESKLVLTRRGQIVCFLLAGISTIISCFLFSLTHEENVAEATSVNEQHELIYLEVAPGDTLWSLAEALDPGKDPRDTIIELKQVNRLGNTQLHIGQKLLLPSRYLRT